MNPIISVIVPVYKVEKYIDRCLNSITNQTYKELEILVIDDGSPDTCPRIVDEWATRDSRIKVFHKQNGGLSDARNYGLDRMTGEYIAFVDSDDYIEKEMFSEMMNAIIDTGSDLACCGRFYVSDTQKKRSRCLESRKNFDKNSAIRELLNNGCIEEAAWDKVYAAKLWKNLRFPVNEINEDIVIAPQIINRCEKIIHVGKPFYNYWYNQESITKSGYNEKKDVMFKHMDDLEKYISENFISELKYVDVLKAKYALTTLFAIVLANEERKYKKSYMKFKNILKKSYYQMLKCDNFSKKQKIEAFLMLVGLYKPIWKIKKKMNGGK